MVRADFLDPEAGAPSLAFSHFVLLPLDLRRHIVTFCASVPLRWLEDSYWELGV